MKWKELLKGIPKVTPNHTHKVSKVLRMDVKYTPGMKTLHFYGELTSVSHAGTYSLILTFTGIEATDGLTEREILQGFMPKPTLAKDNIKVRCSCPTQRFRFDTPDRENNAASGRPFGIYHRKTNRAPNNPDNIPGLCHHIVDFVDYLQSKGFIH